jgi:hypothetical protein
VPLLQQGEAARNVGAWELAGGIGKALRFEPDNAREAAWAFPEKKSRRNGEAEGAEGRQREAEDKAKPSWRETRAPRRRAVRKGEKGSESEGTPS